MSVELLEEMANFRKIVLLCFFFNFKMKKKKKLAKNNRYIIFVRASAAPSYFYTLPVEDIVSLIIGR